MREKPLLCVCGPSGCGKTTVVRASKLIEVTSYTTRAPRLHEVDGQDYYFVDHQYFADHAEEFSLEGIQHYAGEQYGAKNSDLLNMDVVVITLPGAINLREKGLNVRIVWFSGPIRTPRTGRQDPTYSFTQFAEVNYHLENDGTVEEAVEALEFIHSL